MCNEQMRQRHFSQFVARFTAHLWLAVKRLKAVLVGNSFQS